MKWNVESRKFTPCLKDKERFSEQDIQKVLRDLIRGLDYSMSFK